MKKIISLLLVIVMLFAFVSCAKKAETAEIKIYDGEGAVLYDYTVELNGKTAGDLLVEKFDADGVEYEIYDGDMISKIGDLEQDSESWTVYWATYLNGDYASVGLFAMELKAGDLVELKYEAMSF